MPGDGRASALADQGVPFDAVSEQDTLDTTQENNASTQRIDWRHILLLGGLMMLGPFSADMYLPSLPAVSQELNASVSLTQVTLTICFLGLALGQLFIGPASDAFGRRRPLLIGLAAFMVASVLCLFAPNIWVLIALRLIQGLAGASVGIAVAVARDLYSGPTLARSIALLMTVNFVAPVIAPVAGGQLARFGWHAVFIALAFVGLAFVLATFFGLRESLPVERRQPSSFGAVLDAARSLVTNRVFMGYSLVGGFCFTVASIYISSAPFVLETARYGFTPQSVSLMFGINAIGLLGGTHLSSRLVDRLSPQTLLLGGGLLLSVATVALVLMALAGIGLVGILPCFFLMITGLGIVSPNAATLALVSTPARIAGSASALLSVIQLSIGSIVAPLVGLVGGGSLISMAASMALFGLAALALIRVLGRQPRLAPLVVEA